MGAGALAVVAAEGDIGGDDALVKIGERDAGDFAEKFEGVVGAFVFELVGADDGDGGEEVGGLGAEFGGGDLIAAEGDEGAGEVEGRQRWRHGGGLGAGADQREGEEGKKQRQTRREGKVNGHG